MTGVPAPGGHRSFWLREALAAEGDLQCRLRSPGDATVDVIVGGGYTGLWTAYQLTEYEPGISIALLEQDICGGGASGRNGGFVAGWWDGLPRVAELFGAPAALELCRKLGECITEIGRWCDRHGVDAWYPDAGYLAVAASEAQKATLDDTLARIAQLGGAEEFAPITPQEVQELSPRRCSGAGRSCETGPRCSRRGWLAVFDGSSWNAASRPSSGARCVPSASPIRVPPGPTPIWSQRVRVSSRSTPGEWRGLSFAATPWPAGATSLSRSPFRSGSKLSAGPGGNASPICERRSTTAHDARREDRVRRRRRIDWDRQPHRRHFQPRPDRGLENRRRVPPHLPRSGRRSARRLVGRCGGCLAGAPPVFRPERGQPVLLRRRLHGQRRRPESPGWADPGWDVLGRADAWTSLSLADYLPRRFPPEPFRPVSARIVNRAVVEKDRQQERSPASSWVIDQVAQLPTRMGYKLPPG